MKWLLGHRCYKVHRRLLSWDLDWNPITSLELQLSLGSFQWIDSWGLILAHQVGRILGRPKPSWVRVEGTRDTVKSVSQTTVWLLHTYRSQTGSAAPGVLQERTTHQSLQVLHQADLKLVRCDGGTWQTKMFYPRLPHMRWLHWWWIKVANSDFAIAGPAAKLWAPAGFGA